MAENIFYSPAEAAQALGVGVTTVKRWVDTGALPAHRTLGGHRKILRSDLLRLSRERDLPLRGEMELNHRGRIEPADYSQFADRLFNALIGGDIEETRSVIQGAYATGTKMEMIGDAIVAPAMARMGHDWESGRINVMHEHRGTELCTAVLHELRPALESTARKDCPIAVGGNPEGDESVLASLLVQLMLLDAGWHAVNLGPHTPLASFQLALRELKPRLIWISATYLSNRPGFLDQFRELCREAERANVEIAVGGRALDLELRAELPEVFYGESLAQLSDFAQSLHPPQRPPKRGRPPKSSN
jgi:MerR family transcriptional regulator, light-induced transcriptional regulator